MIAAPVQKTALMPRGFAAAHDESAPGTWDEFVTSREYLRLHADTISPTASVTISGFSLRIPTSTPLTRPTPAPSPMHARIPSTSRWSDPRLTPTIRFPPKEMTPGVERSMPACMTTSICPSAATARIVM